ncbi:MAG: manganese efflux pump [Syntrophaceae bacterium]|nr:manganese efflux pump [Syntrophaceae bacterium]
MSLATIILLAIALGVDAFSVAIGIGAANNKKSLMPIWRLSLSFGLFQFAMPVAGWFAGATVVDIIADYDHWIAFGLLALIGGKMIWEGFEEESEEDKDDRTRGWPLLMLSIATSIDALAVGFSFSLLKASILFPSVIIGIVCFCMTAVGMIFGKVLAKLFGRKVEIFGGLVLIAIGTRILLDHWK